MTFEAYDPSPEKPRDINEMIDSAKASVPERLSYEQQEAMANLDEAAIADRGEFLNLADIAGVVGGIKPAALIRCGEVTEQSIRKLGLSYQNLPGMDDITIAWTDEVAKELSDSFESLLDVEGEEKADTNRKIGRLLGYPETATEYYIERLERLKSPQDQQLPMIMPAEFDGSTREHFHQFVLSEDNWREEVDSYVTPLEEVTKELAPLAYAKIEKDAKKERFKSGIRKIIGKQPPLPFGKNSSVAIKKV